MDNREITKEIDIVSSETTKTFDKAPSDAAAMYEFAGGENCIAELVRGPSKECAIGLQRLKWRTFSNTRFVVYSMFFVILLVFSVYYAVTSVYYISALSGIVCAFMLFIVLRGESFFVSAMSFDEKDGTDALLSVKFCENNVYVFDGEALTTFEYTQITQFKDLGKCIYLKLKGVKAYADGIVVLKTEKDKEALVTIAQKLPTTK